MTMRIHKCKRTSFLRSITKQKYSTLYEHLESLKKKQNLPLRRLFYYHKIFVHCKLLFLKWDDCQQVLCVYQLVSLLQRTNQKKEGNGQLFTIFLHVFFFTMLRTLENQSSRKRWTSCQEIKIHKSLMMWDSRLYALNIIG